MSSSLSRASHSRPSLGERASGTGFLPRLGTLLLLLVVELLLVSQLADSATVSGREWWAVVLRKSPNLAQAALVAGSFCLVLGGVGLRKLWRIETECTGHAPPFSAWCLAGHLAAFAAWLTVSLLTFHPRINDSPVPEAWTLGWLATSMATVVTWTLTAVPVPLWRTFLPRAVWVAVLAAPLGLLAWGLGRLSRELWGPLTDLTLACVATILEACGQTSVVESEAARIGTPAFQVGILDGCSGYQGIGLTAAFLLGYCVLQHRHLKFPQVLVLIPAAAFVSWAANLFRIAALILVGTHWSSDVALGGFHSHAGWIAFCGIGIGTVLISQRVAWFHREPLPVIVRTPRTRAGSVAPLAFLLPFLVSLSAAMLTGLVTVDAEFAPVVQVLAGGAVLLWFRRSYGSVRTLRWSWTAAGVGAGVCLFWIAASGLTFGEADTASPPAWTELPRGWRHLAGTFWVVNVCLMVPVVEELAFRGYLVRRLQHLRFEEVRPDRFTWRSFAISSVLFGLLHPSHFLGGVVAGMAYALVMAYRGRLGDAVLAHAVTNGLLVLYVWSTGDWQAWG